MTTNEKIEEMKKVKELLADIKSIKGNGKNIIGIDPNQLSLIETYLYYFQDIIDYKNVQLSFDTETETYEVRVIIL